MESIVQSHKLTGWKMAKMKRHVGREILDGLRKLKRGEHGRPIKVPDVATIREESGLARSRFACRVGANVAGLGDEDENPEVEAPDALTGAH